MLRLKTLTLKRCLLVLLTICGYVANAQYTNSWIDFNKTYYKFPVGKTGIYHITQTYLQTIGLGNTPAEQFQLWRNGQQVPLYTSKASGPMGASDYIEFWGEMNDGKPDKRLYRDTSNQLSDKWSLETDTATFFLTVDPAIVSNLRLIDDANNVAGNALPPEPYFMYTLGNYFNAKINPGFAAVVGEYIYSSTYDQGEGYTTGYIYPNNPLIVDHSNLYPYASGPSANFYIAGPGDALNIRNVQVKLNNTLYIDQEVDYFNVMKNQVAIPMSTLNSGSVEINISNICANTNDRMVFSKYELTYPRQFNFGGSSNFEFDLPSSASGNYLEISNFNNGSATPVLYDMSNRKRYVADLSVPALVRFALPASFQARHFVLVSEDASNITTINSTVPRVFKNYGLATNQGNYIIISNPLLYSGTAGNQVEAYRSYRSSPTGGGFNAKTYDIDELTDQFGYGIKRYPESVRSFLKFARDNFSSPPLFTFLIGKGVNYSDAKLSEADPLLPLLDLVPTFGYPASDNLLSANAGETVPTIPIGRLPAINSVEIQQYLNKVKEYESAAVNSPETVDGRAWMKNVVHAIGGSDTYLQAVIYGYMNSIANIIQDTLYGGKVYNFSKNSAFVVQQLTSSQLDALFSEGIGILTYFGHSSATTLEFNLDDPSVYNNSGKYPVFYVNGCNAGDFFGFNPARFNSDEALSERFVLANQRGSIAFIASTHFGIVNYLNIYMNGAYTAISGKKYGASLGEVMKESSKSLLDITGYNDYYGRMHAEEISLDGDPAIKIYAQPKPDYVVEDPLVKVSPTLISVADTNFNLAVKFMNIGRAITDSVILEVKRQYPNGTVTTVIRKKVAGIRFADSLSLQIPINPITDKGENKFIVTVDPDNVVDEISESNNTTTKTFYIIEDEARPIYPYEYSIVNTSSTNFYASTANPLNKAKDYVMEIDTSALFNSTFKKSVTLNSVGGLLEFKPNISLADSTVYYWRTAPAVPAGTAPNWNASSFVYLASGTPGYNQSHYYQFQNDAFAGITLGDDRTYRYDEHPRIVKIGTGLNPYFVGTDMYVALDENYLDYYGCRYNTLQFAVFDSITLEPWQNATQPDGFGRFGSVPRCIHDKYTFEFAYDDTSYRRKAVEFLENLPNGYYVSITNVGTDVNTTFIDQWMADTATLGPGRSLYHILKKQGLIDIDLFTKNLPFLFFYKKGDPRFPIYSFMGPEVNTHIIESIQVNSRVTKGTIESPWFGPVKKWKEFHWSGKDVEPAMPDSVAMQLFGKDNSGNITLLATINPSRDTSISFVDNKVYPFLKMVMINNDTLNGSPNQLRYWRLNADLPPEGAIAPNILFQSKDTLDVGEKLNFAVPFKNVSPFPFDSLKLKLVITDKNNVAHNVVLPMSRPIVSGDTAMITYSLDTKDYGGTNTLFAEFNPDNAQPEQYHFNNFMFQNIYVRPDNFNPLLDVTFDGVHILNRDIVSAQPHIVIKLKDNSRYLALDDTSLMSVQLRLPDGTLRTYSFTNDTLRFTPSSLTPGGTDNTATIDFNPRLLQDGDYELIVTGKDKSGNKAGNVEYRVSFKVINKPMISNLLNYPNPFTTSTAFVFTVTGIDVPQNIKIEIMTITGKIVREITKNELGPLHIGRNITEFKWDGTDQYGQKLANGVYLYRVVTNLNGKSLDKYKAEGDDTDKYFNNGYGKMYLMR